jgi:hypothetical protein
LIDQDEETYSIEMLETWRKLAEYRTHLQQQFEVGVDLSAHPPSDVPLVAETVRLRHGMNVNTAIGETLIACAVPQIWGKERADAIRDVLIEIALNSLSHANQDEVVVSVEPNRIRLSDRGAYFDPLTLANSDGGGGSDAMSHLLRTFGGSIVLTHSHEGHGNETILTVPTSTDHVLAATPCAISLHEWLSELQTEQHAVRMQQCSVVYVLLPRFFTWSEARRVRQVVEDHVPAGKRMIFLAEDISAGVAAALKEEMPEAFIFSIGKSMP